MSAGVLILTDDDRRRAHDLATFAARPERWYRPGGPRPHGGAAGQQVSLQGYRCLFTWSVLQGVPHRHLSVAGERPPPQHHLVVLATAFGFTGWKDAERGIEPGSDWRIEDMAPLLPFVAVRQRIRVAEFDVHA